MASPSAGSLRLSALGPVSGRQSDLQVAFGVFFATPGDAKSDGIVPFGRSDAKSGVVPFGLDAPGCADVAEVPRILAPSPTTLVLPSCRRPPVTPAVAVAAAEEGAPPDLADLAGFLLLRGRSAPSPAPAWQLGGPKPEVGEIGARRRRWGRGGPAAAPPCRQRGGPAAAPPGLTSSSLRSTGSNQRWGRWAAPKVGELGGAGVEGEDDVGGEQRGAPPRGGSTRSRIVGGRRRGAERDLGGEGMALGGRRGEREHELAGVGAVIPTSVRGQGRASSRPQCPRRWRGRGVRISRCLRLARLGLHAHRPPRAGLARGAPSRRRPPRASTAIEAG
jgi:hypothetical protein